MADKDPKRRVTLSQLNVLWEHLNAHRDIALGHNKSAHARDHSRRLWQEVAEALNSMGEGATKSWKEWSSYWVDYKAKLKKKVSSMRAAMSGTGGGPSNAPVLQDIEKRFLDLLGAGFGSGIPGVRVDPFPEMVIDLNEKLDAEITKADKLEIENKKLSSRAASLQRERDKLLGDRDTLRETVDDLYHYTITAGPSEDNVSQELIPTEMKDKLIRLEHENKLLRQNQGAQADQASVQALLEDYASRLEKQRALHRESSQRIMQLEAALEAAPARDPRLATAMEDSQRKSLQVEELQAALAEERRRAGKLQETLSARDAELVATEEKYKRCVEKAKEVIKSLDPRAAALPSLSDITLGYARGAGAGAARGDATPANNRHEWSGSGNSSSEGRGSTEQRLLTSAWYQLGARCHRDAVETRFALLSAGHSFLARQRRQPPRPRPAMPAP